MNFKMNKKIYYTIWHDNGEEWEDHYTKDLHMFFEKKKDAATYLNEVLYKELSEELEKEKKEEDYPYPNACWKKKILDSWIGPKQEAIVFIYDAKNSKKDYGEHYYVKKDIFAFMEKENE